MPICLISFSISTVFSSAHGSNGEAESSVTSRYWAEQMRDVPQHKTLAGLLQQQFPNVLRPLGLHKPQLWKQICRNKLHTPEILRLGSDNGVESPRGPIFPQADSRTLNNDSQGEQEEVGTYNGKQGHPEASQGQSLSPPHQAGASGEYQHIPGMENLSCWPQSWDTSRNISRSISKAAEVLETVPGNEEEDIESTCTKASKRIEHLRGTSAQSPEPGSFAYCDGDLGSIREVRCGTDQAYARRLLKADSCEAQGPATSGRAGDAMATIKDSPEPSSPETPSLEQRQQVDEMPSLTSVCRLSLSSSSGAAFLQDGSRPASGCSTRLSRLDSTQDPLPPLQSSLCARRNTPPPWNSSPRSKTGHFALRRPQTSVVARSDSSARSCRPATACSASNTPRHLQGHFLPVQEAAAEVMKHSTLRDASLEAIGSLRQCLMFPEMLKFGVRRHWAKGGSPL